MFLPGYRRHATPGRGDLTGFDQELSRFELVGIFEQATLRRSGGARSVRVVRATVTRAQEQVRLRKPAHGAAEVRTVDREHLELLTFEVTHPASDARGFAVPRVRHGVAIGGETRLAFREPFHRAERQPGLVSGPPLARDRRQDVTNDRNAHDRGNEQVEADAQPDEQRSSCNSVGSTHRSSPTLNESPAFGPLEAGREGRDRCAASHATTSETSSDDSALPAALLRQSGAPSSGRPTMTVVRKLWLLTRARKAPSTMELARCPPRSSPP